MSGDNLNSPLGGGELDELALTHVSNLIAEAQPGSMVTKFVLLVETADGEDRWMASYTSPGMKAWESIGILEYAMMTESNFDTRLDDETDERD